MMDKATDVEHMLRALYERRYFCNSKAQPVYLVTSILRLSTKYQIDHLREDAINRLKQDCPTSLDVFDKKSRKIHYYVAFKKSPFITMEIVNLALEMDVHWALPSALLLCCEAHSYEEIVDGVVKPDGACICLPADAQNACVKAKASLLERLAQEVFAWLESPSAGCKRTIECKSYKRDLFHSLFFPTPRIRPFKQWDPEWTQNLCSSCKEDAKRNHNEGRRRLWKKLPTIFGLPPWVALTK